LFAIAEFSCSSFSVIRDYARNRSGGVGMIRERRVTVCWQKRLTSSRDLEKQEKT
jgi:hypothetical protein